MDRAQLKYLFNKYHLAPKRENSQNFLIDGQVVRDLLNSADLKKDDIVLEIGAGLGAVTSELCQKVKKVIAVEIDQNFLPVLQNLAKVNKNLEIINQDIFKIDLNKIIKKKKFKIVSSLPYNITSLFFRYFLEHGPQPSLISVIIQKEVAERITEMPGSMSLLSLSVQLFGQPKIHRIVPRSSFWPQPNVDSAIIVVKNITNPKDISDIKQFFRLLRICFAAKRKKLANNLENGLKIDRKIITQGLKELNISDNCRAQELALKDWVKLFDHYKRIMI